MTTLRSICIILAALTIAPLASADDRARLTIGIPAYVSHPDNRRGAEDWNQGWFRNEGVLVDATWPVHSLSAQTTLRAGVTGGVFDNSIYRTSVFAGGVGEIETYVSKDLALSLGTYAGVITGYERSVSPSIAPYVGASYALTDRLELGARGFWLPARTLAGSSIAESDAYVAAVTVGTRF